jgi:hypothetical protein
MSTGIFGFSGIIWRVSGDQAGVTKCSGRPFGRPLRSDLFDFIESEFYSIALFQICGVLGGTSNATM